MIGLPNRVRTGGSELDLNRRDPCISERGTRSIVTFQEGRGRPGDPGPRETASKRGSPRPKRRSKSRTVEGAATTRARIRLQGRVSAPAQPRKVAMGGVNAAIDVGKRQLAVGLGSAGEQFTEPNEPRAIKRLIKRLAEAGLSACWWKA